MPRLPVRPAALCGQYRASFSAVCHGKTCQKQSGTAFNIVIAVPQPAVLPTPSRCVPWNRRVPGPVVSSDRSWRTADGCYGG
jgi:hypothetical protein